MIGSTSLRNGERAPRRFDRTILRLAVEVELQLARFGRAAADGQSRPGVTQQQILRAGSATLPGSSRYAASIVSRHERAQVGVELTEQRAHQRLDAVRRDRSSALTDERAQRRPVRRRRRAAARGIHTVSAFVRVADDARGRATGCALPVRPTPLRWPAARRCSRVSRVEERLRVLRRRRSSRPRPRARPTAGVAVRPLLVTERLGQPLVQRAELEEVEQLSHFLAVERLEPQSVGRDLERHVAQQHHDVGVAAHRGLVLGEVRRAASASARRRVRRCRRCRRTC